MPKLYVEVMEQMPCACCGKPQHGPLYLHQRCHPQGGIKAHFAHSDLHVMCAVCNRRVASLPIIRPPEAEEGEFVEHTPIPECHTNSKVFIQYEDGKLTFECATCERHLGEMEVQHAPNAH